MHQLARICFTAVQRLGTHQRQYPIQQSGTAGLVTHRPPHSRSLQLIIQDLIEGILWKEDTTPAFCRCFGSEILETRYTDCLHVYTDVFID